MFGLQDQYPLQMRAGAEETRAIRAGEPRARLRAHGRVSNRIPEAAGLDACPVASQCGPRDF